MNPKLFGFILTYRELEHAKEKLVVVPLIKEQIKEPFLAITFNTPITPSSHFYTSHKLAILNMQIEATMI